MKKYHKLQKVRVSKPSAPHYNQVGTITKICKPSGYRYPYQVTFTDKRFGTNQYSEDEITASPIQLNRGI